MLWQEMLGQLLFWVPTSSQVHFLELLKWFSSSKSCGPPEMTGV